MSRVRWSLGCLALLAAAGTQVVRSQEYKSTIAADHPAIDYARLLDRDPLLPMVSPVDPAAGVPPVLEALRIAPDSQMLVFSKTSVQARSVSPANPRAIYFNDDTVVAYVPGASTIEIAQAHPERGMLFYTWSVGPDVQRRLTRSTTCLRCHHGANTAGVPGLYVGSVIPGPTGAPLRDDSAIITDHRTPFRDRWGGWYVTAKRGQQPDRANAVAIDPSAPDALAREAQQNVSSLAGRFERARYPADTSDIVALMTFEHQTQMMNLMTRVAWQARIALHAGRTDPMSDSGVQAEVDELVAYMLFVDEAALVERIEGTSSFAATFARRGPHDRRGRSLREFDLERRLFRYPLSYLIHGKQFGWLPTSVRQAVYRRLRELLTAEALPARYAHLAGIDRRAIVEILQDTIPEFVANSQ